MAQRKAPSLAFSEYVSPDSDNSVQVWYARLQLIEAVKRVYPKFLKKLLTDVFPLYRQLAEKDHKFEKALWTKSPYEALTENGGLKSALSRWAADFNAQSEWLMVGALRTLRGWHTYEDWRKSLKWYTNHSHAEALVIGGRFEFSHQGWEVQLLTWSRYRELLHKGLEEKLLQYETTIRELAKSKGLVLAQRKYSPDNLEWFVLYQFAGKSSTAIANASRNAVDDSTVLKGIKAAAKLIHWDHLRETKATRIRKIR